MLIMSTLTKQLTIGQELCLVYDPPQITLLKQLLIFLRSNMAQGQGFCHLFFKISELQYRTKKVLLINKAINFKW